MEEVRSIASDNGASQIELVATSTNVVAREFYRSLGFVEAVCLSRVRRISRQPAQPER